MPQRLRRTLLPAVFLIVAAVIGCDRKELAPGVSDSTFVGAMAGLRRLPARSMVDSAARSRARDSVLRHYRVTGVQLESAASVLASDPERASAVWAAIDRKMNTPDTTRTPRVPRTAAPSPPGRGGGVPAPKTP
jgi:hypothetical protein